MFRLPPCNSKNRLALSKYTQILYLICHSLFFPANLDKKATSFDRTNRAKIKPGNFSLVVFLLLGIFFHSPLEAVQTVKEDITVIATYTASFSFDIGAFVPRAHIYPDRVYFNASGTNETFSSIPAYSSDFQPWETSYSLNSWSSAQSTALGQYTPFTQIAQIPTTTSSNFTPGSICLAAITRVPASTSFRLEFSTYNSEADLFSNAASGPSTLANNVQVKTPAMVVSRKKVYLFWLSNNDSSIHLMEIDNSIPATETLISPGDVNDTFGLGGSLLNIDGTDTVAVVYGVNASTIKILKFPDGNPVSQTTSTVNVSNFSVQHADICQNPRTGFIYLTWLDSQTQYYLKSSQPGKLDFSTSIPVAIPGTWKGTIGMSIEAFSNFELDFALPSTANSVNNIALKSPVTTVQDFGENANSQLFRYQNSGNTYIGLLNSLGFEYRFRRRLLEFPLEHSWQKSSKVLHIEGPPLMNSVVSAAVDFAEVATSSCIAQTINSGGNSTAFVGNSNIIASRTNPISVIFDKPMNLDNSMIGSKIRLFDAGNNPIAIVADTPLTSGIRFKLDQDLNFAGSYYIQIASDVVDANGSQIWSDSRLNFTTQPARSSVLASEVISLSAHSTAARDGTDQISNGTEVNATTTVYLRLQAVDPAFNTIDVATVTVLLNSATIAEVTMTQTSANSSFFHGQYNLTAPHGGNNLYEFVSAASAIKTSVRVDFPTLLSVTPADSTSGVLINTQPKLTFSENMAPASVNSSSVKLTRGASQANYTVSLSGATVTIDPADSSESFLLTETSYQIAAGYGLTDVKGNPFVTSPATFTSVFSTQASQTRPISISSAKLYADNTFTTVLGENADYAATGTVYLEFTGVDGANLTRDFAIASFSNGNLVRLEETASASAIYRGSYSFSGLNDRFKLTAQSIKSPGVSASLLITYPRLTPETPASGAANVSLGTNLIIAADEALNAADVNGANIKLFQNGSEVSKTLSYAAGKITINPDADMLSEKTYLVRIENIRDLSGNPMLKPLIYQFTCEDLTQPTVVSFYPAQNQAGLTIDQNIQIDFSENMQPASINSTSIKLTRSGTAVSATLSLSGNRLRIDPNDSNENYLRPDSAYRLEITNLARDIAGNGLAGAPFILNFTTQPRQTPPTAIESLTIFKDPLLLSGWSSNEKVPASATIYLKLTGTDGATQTRDIATAVLDLSWNGSNEISLLETASNSNGFYIGQFNLGSLPLYGFPNPQPAISIGSLTFLAQQAPAKAATLTLSFPELVNAETQVESLGGTVAANGATNVRNDSSITFSFSDTLLNSGSSANLIVASGGSPITGTRVLSADKRKIIFTPTAALPFASTISLSGTYAETGLKSSVGNPLFRAFNLSFSTQASQTQPLAITQVSLFSDNSFSAASAYAGNDDFAGSGDIYIEFKGTDGAANTLDSTLANISNGNSVRLNEISAGVFRGQYSFSNLADGTVLTVSSAVTPGASQTLKLSYPVLSQISPASGAAGISIFSSFAVGVSESLDLSRLTTDNVRLLKNGTAVAVSISWNSSQKMIEIVPNAPLDYAGIYSLIISNQQDLVGNPQKNGFLSSFSTQASSVSPTVVNSIKAFSDNAFTVEIADNGLVAPSTQAYFEISATDLSPATVDSTMAQIKSNLTAATVQIALIETGPATGIFRGSRQLFDEEGATITISSLTQPSVLTRIRTLAKPTITSLQPASGSSDIYLDTRFIIKTGKAVSAATVDTSAIIISDSSGIASYLPVLANAGEIWVYSQLEADSNVTLKVNNLLQDTDGISFPQTIATYRSVAPKSTGLQLFADSGFTTLIANNSQVEAGQTIWARINGTDAYANQIETQNLLAALPDATSTVVLSETSAGIFSGSFVVPAAPGKVLQVTAQNNTQLVIRLEILADFAITSFSPASGAVSVPADVWPTWNFSRPVKVIDANSSNFKIVRVSDGSLVAGTVSQSPTTRQIRFQPNNIFKLLTEYEMIVEGSVRDENNNTLGSGLRTRFVTQPPPAPPTVISLFDNYESTAYATSTRAVASNGTLYLKMVASDESFSTYDTARVRLDSSDGSLDGLELTLIEVSPPSGVFTLAYPVNLAAGTTVRVQPQVAPGLEITITVFNRTSLVSVAPASGSTGLLLDTPLRLTFSQPILATSISSGITIVADKNYSFSGSLENSGRDVILQPTTGLATGAAHLLKINTGLKDTNGLFLLPGAIGFSTLGESLAQLEMYTGLAPRAGQAVSLTGEAINGPIGIVATTTNLFATLPETRLLTINAATQSFNLQLSESQAGLFTGTFNPPAGIVQTGLIASLSFATRPSISFNLAPQPVLLQTLPASSAADAVENQIIIATFSRKMAFESGQNAALINFPGGQTAAVLMNSSDTEVLSWQPTLPLPLQASCTLVLSGLTDYLGQVLSEQRVSFSTSGLQGINLYNDSGFSLRIATDQLQLPLAFAEIAASTTSGLSGQIFNLQVRTGTRATSTVLLPLQPVSESSGRFRCQLEFEPSKSLPGYNVPLLPGEWLELTSSKLTSDKKIFYYRFSGAAEPLKINGISFFHDKDFAQALGGELPLSRLYIQIEADDLNWFTTDTTRVRITSDADRTGFSLNLSEAGTHSSFFRGRIEIDGNSSNAVLNRILAQPGNRIKVQSETDPSVTASIVYLPESGLRMVSAFPSPVRGNSMFFRFYLNFPGNVEIEIYDTAGHEIDSLLVRGREGENKQQWRLPRHLANGVYFYVMKLTDSTAYPSKKRKYRGKFAVLR